MLVTIAGSHHIVWALLTMYLIYLTLLTCSNCRVYSERWTITMKETHNYEYTMFEMSLYVVWSNDDGSGRALRSGLTTPDSATTSYFYFANIISASAANYHPLTTNNAINIILMTLLSYTLVLSCHLNDSLKQFLVKVALRLGGFIRVLGTCIVIVLLRNQLTLI